MREGSDSYSTTKRVLYQLHVNGAKVAVIFGFIHGIVRSPIDQIYMITGWLFGIVMVILTGLGAFLSIKTKSKPMNREDDVKWRKIRIIKWILTVLVLPALALHYFLSGWLL
jgi:Zn-dependent protease